MAYRIEAFLAFGLTLAAQPFEFAARHDRLLRDRAVTIRVGEEGVSAGSMKWVWDDIQQLTVSENELRLMSYSDSNWRGGRDREWLFEQIPKGAAEKLYPFFTGKLDQRLVAAIAVPVANPLWELPVKLHSGLGGSDGMLTVGSDLIVYHSRERNQSRTLRIWKDIENLSSAGPFDLVLTTHERRGLLHGGPSELRFQLKRPLAAERYESLWRQIHKSKGLEILQSYRGEQNR